MPREIPKAYEPQEIEQRWSRAWVERNLFRADPAAPGPVFSIVLPPPNVTGSIHIGHMLEHTQIDILVRWRRMQGHNTLWLPGTDHAGIGTQVVVERELAKENLTRKQIGREEFERRVWQWKGESGDTIKRQMIRLGASCDWTRERFTLDAPLYRAVLEAFLRLYREGLIYRGRYMVNWCPRCQTALSDLETVHEERAGKLWHIRYPLVGTETGTDGFLVVATTRPETMLGDTAVAVHPEDARYSGLVGKKVRLPLMDREIPVIADSYVDREFGTGALKVTPAHDPNDFELGKRHHLPEIDVLTDDGHMSQAAGKYAGMDRFAARQQIIEDLRALGLLERVTNHTHSVGICDRCKTEIEPRASTQWFVRMKPLAEPAIQVVREELITIVPENWTRVYLHWMENIHDWCISRQLWWGHRIPIWHCADCGAMTPAQDSRVEVVNGRAQAAGVPARCSACGSAQLQQDSDVLDTWFSSGLWPLSTLGWPDDTVDLRTYYPTSLLISGYDILFFWDARMIMMGLHLAPRSTLEQRIPFHKLYLHAIVRDPQGLKMSKARGNVVDPLEVTEKHGTDALRFALAVMAAPGTDIALSEERILGYRAFANKIWNAARFVLSRMPDFQALGVEAGSWLAPQEGEQLRASDSVAGAAPLIDRWIFSRLAQVTQQMDDALENFRFHEAAHVIYHFFWHDFCDWYLEWVKPAVTSADAAQGSGLGAWRRLIQAMSSSLRLLHPLMPFITEELWQQLRQATGRTDYRSLALERFAVVSQDAIDLAAEQETEILQEIITAARNIRAEFKLEPRRKAPADLAAANAHVRSLVEENEEAILRLANLSALHFAPGPFDPSSGAIRSTAQFDLRIRYEEAVDLRAEVARLRKETERLARDLETKRSRLADETFRGRAPEQVVRSLESTTQERQVEYEKLVARLTQLEASLSAHG